MPDQVRHDERGDRVKVRRYPPNGGNPNSSARSRHSGFAASINAIFHLRCQLLIGFSRVIAACIIPARSNQTSVLTP